MYEARKNFEERHWDFCEGQLDSWVVFWDCEGIRDFCIEVYSGVSARHFEEFGPGVKKDPSQNCYFPGLYICGVLRE